MTGGGGIRGEGGYSLIEMLTVMAILGIVLGGLTTLFVQGSNAQLEMNTRFRAQTEARVALDRIRREIHCASRATPQTTGAPSQWIELELPAQCKGGGGIVKWCAVGSGTRWGLYRSTADPCDASDRRYADFVTRSDLFTYTPQAADDPNTTTVDEATLARLHVELPVDVEPTDSIRGYELRDDIVLRNSVRENP